MQKRIAETLVKPCSNWSFSSHFRKKGSKSIPKQPQTVSKPIRKLLHIDLKQSWVDTKPTMHLKLCVWNLMIIRFRILLHLKLFACWLIGSWKTSISAVLYGTDWTRLSVIHKFLDGMLCIQVSEYFSSGILRAKFRGLYFLKLVVNIKKCPQCWLDLK